MQRTNVDIVRQIYEAFRQRNEAEIYAFVSPEIKTTQSRALPWGGEYSGRDGLRRFLMALFQHVDSRVEIERYVDAGEHVVAVGHTIGTVRAGGRPFDVPVIHVWHFRDGQAIGFHPYIENAKMLAALGA